MKGKKRKFDSANENVSEALSVRENGQEKKLNSEMSVVNSPDKIVFHDESKFDPLASCTLLSLFLPRSNVLEIREYQGFFDHVVENKLDEDEWQANEHWRSQYYSVSQEMGFPISDRDFDNKKNECWYLTMAMIHYQINSLSLFYPDVDKQNKKDFFKVLSVTLEEKHLRDHVGASLKLFSPIRIQDEKMLGLVVDTLNRFSLASKTPNLIRHTSEAFNETEVNNLILSFKVSQVYYAIFHFLSALRSLSGSLLCENMALRYVCCNPVDFVKFCKILIRYNYPIDYEALWKKVIKYRAYSAFSADEYFLYVFPKLEDDAPADLIDAFQLLTLIRPNYLTQETYRKVIISLSEFREKSIFSVFDRALLVNFFHSKNLGFFLHNEEIMPVLHMFNNHLVPWNNSVIIEHDIKNASKLLNLSFDRFQDFLHYWGQLQSLSGQNCSIYSAFLFWEISFDPYFFKKDPYVGFFKHFSLDFLSLLDLSNYQAPSFTPDDDAVFSFVNTPYPVKRVEGVPYIGQPEARMIFSLSLIPAESRIRVSIANMLIQTEFGRRLFEVYHLAMKEEQAKLLSIGQAFEQSKAEEGKKMFSFCGIMMFSRYACFFAESTKDPKILRFRKVALTLKNILLKKVWTNQFASELFIFIYYLASLHSSHPRLIDKLLSLDAFYELVEVVIIDTSSMALLSLIDKMPIKIKNDVILYQGPIKNMINLFHFCSQPTINSVSIMLKQYHEKKPLIKELDLSLFLYLAKYDALELLNNHHLLASIQNSGCSLSIIQLLSEYNLKKLIVSDNHENQFDLLTKIYLYLDQHANLIDNQKIKSVWLKSLLETIINQISHETDGLLYEDDFQKSVKYLCLKSGIKLSSSTTEQSRNPHRFIAEKTIMLSNSSVGRRGLVNSEDSSYVVDLAL